MRFGGITSGAEYRMDEKFKNLPVVTFLIVFQIEKIQKIY